MLAYGLVLIFSLSWTSCDTEYLDPNSTLEPQVVSNVDNLARLINGIQQRWSTDRAGVIYTSVHITGLNTQELRLLNPGNLGENEIFLGGTSIAGNNELLNNLWTNAMLCKKEATTVLNAADEATDNQQDANTLKAYAHFYRALVHGTLIQYFQQIPLDLVENAPFQDRNTVLNSVLNDLRMAQDLSQQGLSSTVTSKVFSSVQLQNSIAAMLARFHLMAGNYSDAITATNQVDLNVSSTWVYDAAITNPLAFWFGSQNVTQARDIHFGLPTDLRPDAADKRVPFYIRTDSPDDNPDYQLEGFWKTNTSEIPLYLPGEIHLIRAEAYARNDALEDAVDHLNEVLTKTTADDLYGLAAELPGYSGALTKEAILSEIYRNRRIELYLTGQSLEDTRRFNRPGATATNAERNRDYYPYPNNERDNNSNTPDNPPT